MYRELDISPEEGLQKYWKKIDLLNITYTGKKDKPKYVFYEGPPTANGSPAIHHVMARALKDSVLRYKTMKGSKIRRKAGWDTHGLPVEIEVEKKLGLADKAAIENFGIGEFNKLCRESVFEYENLWRIMTERMGYLIDLDNPYITLDNDYIETLWWILDKFNREGLIYDGHKILPYCTRCGTGLASHEVAQGYMEIKTATVYVKFKIKDRDEYFLVWTTTPWTLPANVALTVNPEETYVKLKNNGEIYYIEKHLVDTVIEGEYEILESFKGSQLEGIKYEQILPFVEPDSDAFIVTLADYVTVSDGTGIVHTAPAFGEDDYQTGQKYDLPVIQPVSLDGKFTCTPWEGKFVMDADPDIIEYLRDNNKLYKRQRMDHNYPHCWRCKTPLLYYAKQGWFIEMTKLREELIAANNEVNWYPDFVGEKRFGNWLENLNDWAISRSRYWGTPLNIWTCDCGSFETIGSVEELRKRSIGELPEDLDLHRPYVDDIKIKCSKCSSEMNRVPDVIDCWFDSGAMPFAQYHYPFENKELFDEQFPADFICEGIDQTRGWFYSLLAISTFVMGRAPYKNVLVNDMLLDKYGKKMSKTSTNMIDVFSILDEFGADSTRWYLFYVSPAWLPTKFDKDALAEICSKFFGTIKNLYNFFTLYANTDSIDASQLSVGYDERPELDQWIISKFNRLVKTMTKEMEVFNHMRSVRAIQEFVVEDFSNWYIRRSRSRFWASDMTKDKVSVFRTTYEMLVGVSKLIAPFAPFISEEIYRNLTSDLSVHMADFPVSESRYIDDRIEARMDLVRDLVSLGRSARESVKIKVRQPISSVVVDGRHEELISDLAPLIMEELNVKEVIFEKDLPNYMNFSLKPNFKVLGPILGPRIKDFAKALSQMDQAQSAMDLEAGSKISVTLSDGSNIEAGSDQIMMNITAKEGYTVRLENNNFIILDTTLTDELIDEGYARELVSKVQQQRKSMDLEMMDQIEIYYSAGSEFVRGAEKHAEYIKSQTLAVKLEQTDDFGNMDYKSENLNGADVKYSIKKI